MQGMLRIQDIIGLILAILIVAILISIILILRESARERKLWKEENEDFEEEPKIKKRRCHIIRQISYDNGFIRQQLMIIGFHGILMYYSNVIILC